jgi:hypothetical protein
MMSRFQRPLIFASVILVFSLQSLDLGASVDNNIYADLLRKYVKDGVVEYSGFKEEEKRLDAYLDILAKVDPDTLNRNEQFAFYVNAYNAWTIKLILSGYPGVSSIKDLGSLFKSPWKKEIARIDGDLVTLDHIEHEVLRPRFKDPRIHFAVNCASKSCPPLISEPYQGDILEQQLDAATEAFLNDPEQNRLEEDTLYVSRIFKWYSEDFGDGVVNFFLTYANATLKSELMEKRNRIKVKHLRYDWSLNGK